MITETARVSSGAVPNAERDKGLINFLLRNDHKTPFESCVFRFKVKAPIFVARQWVKHRISSWNEKSARYQDFGDMSFIYPYFKSEGTKGHPIDNIDSDRQADLYDNLDSIYGQLKIAYNGLVDEGIAKEQARVIMPVGAFTEWIWTVNLSSLYNFLKLRTSEHAQKEIRVYAEAIISLLKYLPEFEYSIEAIEGMIEVDKALKRLLNINKDLKLTAAMIDKLSDKLLFESNKD